MKNKFLATVEELQRPDWLEMTPREMASPFQGDRNGLDPMNRVLEDEEFAESEHQLMGQKGVRRTSSDIEEKRAFGAKHTAEFLSPQTTPIEVFTPASAVVVTSVFGVDVIRRRSDDHVDRFVFQRLQAIDTIPVTQI